MGFNLYWDDDAQQVMLIEVGAHWTWDEMHSALGTVKSIQDKRDGRLQAAIVDARRGIHLPDPPLSPTTLNHARRVAALAPRGTGPIVVVGANPLLRGLFDQLRKLDARATANIHFADTLDAARVILAERLHQRVSA
jgi:hypothetical protein